MTDVTPKTKTTASLAIIIGFGVIGIGAALAAAWFGVLSRPTVNQGKPQPLTVRQLHQQFLTSINEYLKTPATNRTAILPLLTQRARERQVRMQQLLTTNPAEFLELALPGSVRDHLPPPVQPLIEQETDVEGTLVIHHADNFKDQKSDDRYVLESSEPPFFTPVYFATTPAEQLLGARVKVHGHTLNAELATSGAAETTQVITPAATATITGPKKVAVILFNFQNDQTQPITVTGARRAFFTDANSTNAYYQEASFNQLSLVGKTGNADGDVYGWVTVPYNKTPCDYDDWGAAADSLIGSTVLEGYDYYVYLFPSVPTCGFTGVATIGGNRSYLNGTTFSEGPGVLVHEIGHNFGTHHASTYSCTAAGQRVSYSATCTTQEYGDPFDPMGAWNSRRLMNNFRHGLFGWYGPENTYDITTIGSHTHPLMPMAGAGSGYKALRIPRTFLNGTVTDYLYLEYRRPFGQFDNYLLSDPVVNGVSVRIARPYETGATGLSYLLDATPATSSYGDSALPPGQSLNDSIDGINITTNSVNSSQANVTVTLTCEDNPPFLHWSGVSSRARPGTALTFTLNATNKDSFICPAGQFTLTATAPTGWPVIPPQTVTLSPSYLTAVNLTVTSPATATEGAYPIPVTLASVSPSGFSASTTLYHTIDTIAPTVTIIQPPNNFTLPSVGQVTISANGTDDNSFSAAVSIAIDGTTVKQCPLLSNGTPCIYDWVINAAVSANQHTITATASDEAGNTSSTSITVNPVAGGAGGLKCGADQGLPPCPQETQ